MCILLTIISFIFLIIIEHFVDNKYYKEPKVDNKCPHGFEDWDDCPDCCH